MPRLLLDYLAFVDEHRDLLEQFDPNHRNQLVNFMMTYDAVSDQIFIHWNNDGKKVSTRINSHQMFEEEHNHLLTMIKTLAIKKQINERVY